MHEVTVALIGLAGTVLTGSLAYLQVKKRQKAAATRKNQEKIFSIHESIWHMTEDISLLLREPYPHTAFQVD